MTRYRAVPYDEENDVWALKRRFLWFFWLWEATGCEWEVKEAEKRLNRGEKVDPKNLRMYRLELPD